MAIDKDSDAVGQFYEGLLAMHRGGLEVLSVVVSRRSMRRLADPASTATAGDGAIHLFGPSGHVRVTGGGND